MSLQFVCMLSGWRISRAAWDDEREGVPFGAPAAGEGSASMSLQC